jgi:hypothetical protein
VAHEGVVRASDRGWGAVMGAADGEPEPRRRSGEQWWPEQGKWNGTKVCKSQDVY